MSRVARYEVDIIHEGSGESMTVELGEELWDDEDKPSIDEVINIILNDISIVPRFIGYDQ